MVDKISALPRARLRDRVGQLEDADLKNVETALTTFLGMSR
jgi:mRNA-degrading endonuclease toxin of MazEF toxin-antitoxin module